MVVDGYWRAVVHGTDQHLTATGRLYDGHRVGVLAVALRRRVLVSALRIAASVHLEGVFLHRFRVDHRVNQHLRGRSSFIGRQTRL